MSKPSLMCQCPPMEECKRTRKSVLTKTQTPIIEEPVKLKKRGQDPPFFLESKKRNGLDDCEPNLITDYPEEKKVSVPKFKSVSSSAKCTGTSDSVNVSSTQCDLPFPAVSVPICPQPSTVPAPCPAPLTPPNCKSVGVECGGRHDVEIVVTPRIEMKEIDACTRPCAGCTCSRCPASPPHNKRPCDFGVPCLPISPRHPVPFGLRCTEGCPSPPCVPAPCPPVTGCPTCPPKCPPGFPPKGLSGGCPISCPPCRSPCPSPCAPKCGGCPTGCSPYPSCYSPGCGPCSPPARCPSPCGPVVPTARCTSYGTSPCRTSRCPPAQCPPPARYPCSSRCPSPCGPGTNARCALPCPPPARCPSPSPCCRPACATKCATTCGTPGLPFLNTSCYPQAGCRAMSPAPCSAPGQPFLNTHCGPSPCRPFCEKKSIFKRWFSRRC